MNIAKKIFNNTGKPEGVLGKMMVNSMNKGHAKVSEWGRTQFPSMNPENIIDLGCGGGQNLAELMKKYPGAKASGLDYSEVSVKKAAEMNAEAIKNGRCKIIEGDVSRIPFENESFDLATAFETVYFWPGPAESFREVFRILKPGSHFIIVNETDGFNEADRKWEEMIDKMQIFSIEDMCAMLEDAGFKNISVKRKTENFWISFIAEK